MNKLSDQPKPNIAVLGHQEAVDSAKKEAVLLQFINSGQLVGRALDSRSKSGEFELQQVEFPFPQLTPCAGSYSVSVLLCVTAVAR